MAVYRLNYKKGKKGYARNHAAYILREEGYQGKEDLIYKEYSLPSVEGSNAIKFWEYADTYERANSCVYRELELNIPNEFSHDQAKELIKTFVKKEIGENFPYTYAIHEAYNKEGEKNLHCHLMFSERENDGIERNLDSFFKRANSKKPELGGAKKNRIWQEKDRLIELRKSWEIEQNLALEKYGFETRVDCRSLQDIRKELIEKEKFDEAEKYNRKAININGKILYKVDRNIKLNALEQEKYNSFLKSKEKKRIKEVEYKLSQNISLLPEEKEIAKQIEEAANKRIEKLEKQSSKERALNILSKGNYFKTKKEFFKISKKLKQYPQNSILINTKQKLEEDIQNIEKKYMETSKYWNVVTQLERDNSRNLAKEKDYFQDTFKKDYLNNEQKKIIDKYSKKKDRLSLKIKEKLIQLENTHLEEKTINILSKYEYNKELIQGLILQDKKEELTKKKEEYGIYYPRELKQVNTDIENNEKEINKNQIALEKIIDTLEKTQIKELSDRIKKNNDFELKTIREILLQDHNKPDALEIQKEKIALLHRESFLEKVYTKELEKEKVDYKKLYSISKEIDAIKSLQENDYQIDQEYSKEVVKENIHIIQKNIDTNTMKVEKAEKILKKVEAKDAEAIVINKISNGKYAINMKKQKKLKTILEKEKEALKNMGVISFGKGVLKKSIDLHQEQFSKLIKENHIIKEEAKKHHNFKDDVIKLENYHQKIIHDYSLLVKTLKQENRINNTLKYSIEKNSKFKNLNKILKKEQKLRHVRASSNGKNIKRRLNEIFKDNQEIRSTLDITLKRERDNEWER